MPKILSDYGCYIYEIPFEILKVNGEKEADHTRYGIYSIRDIARLMA